MSTPTPRTDKRSESLLSKTFLTSYVTMQELARTLERELAESRNAERLARVQLGAERERVRVLRNACESICEEWGENHDANPIGAGQKMETLASKALEDMEEAQ